MKYLGLNNNIYNILSPSGFNHLNYKKPISSVVVKVHLNNFNQKKPHHSISVFLPYSLVIEDH